jgi:nitrogen regulatory protein PII
MNENPDSSDKVTDVIYLTDVSTITCVVAAARADEVLLAGRDAGAGSAIVQTVQGYGMRERLGVLGVAVEAQQAVITFLVSTDQQDVIFDTIYRVAGFDQMGAGFMYITPLDKAATYVPKSIRERLDLEKR